MSTTPSTEETQSDPSEAGENSDQLAAARKATFSLGGAVPTRPPPTPRNLDDGPEPAALPLDPGTAAHETTPRSPAPPQVPPVAQPAPTDRAPVSLPASEPTVESPLAPMVPGSPRTKAPKQKKPPKEQKAPKRVLGYRRQRFEARKVRRLIRHVDPWSMLKLSVLVSLCMWFITMIAALILWTVARNSGTISSIEDFVNSSLQLQDWKLDGEFLFRQFGLITLLLALGGAAAMVVAALVFNLISDIIGGVWVSVIEEETARPVGTKDPGPDSR